MKGKKPKFSEASFMFIWGTDEYEVKFTPTENKLVYEIECSGPGIVLYRGEAVQVATKTTALYRLCKALNLDTDNIH